MPTVVVILPTSTYRASDFVAAAESTGIELVVASEEPPPLDMGDRFVKIDCSEPDRAAETIARLGDTRSIDGIIAADDQGVVVAAAASTLLGLPGNPRDAAEATRDKLRMRQRLAKSEVAQPRFAPLPAGSDVEEAAVEVGFPVVIKPIDRSASQGVIRANDIAELRSAVSTIRGIVGEGATLLLEEYMPGTEIAIEGLVADSELGVLAVFDKPDTSEGPTFPETIFVTPSRIPETERLEAERVAAGAVRGLGLTQGPVHIELRITNGRARVIEVAARSIGGLCSRSLNFGLMGTTLESLILRNAMGLGRKNLRREAVSSGVLMIPTPASGTLESVGGIDAIRDIEGITGIDLTMVPGDRIVAPPVGDRYLGFVYGRSDSPDRVETALREAMAKLEVQLEG